MKLAITGANGFIGQYVVTEALAHGHDVVAISRKAGHHNDNPSIKVAVCPNFSQAELAQALTGVDAVIHLAAAMQGPDQHQQTLTLTRHVLAAMDEVGVSTLVAISSISVLDYVSPPPMSVIDESSPICNQDSAMGNYALMKRDQEELYRQWQQPEKSLTILRPGLVYSDQQLSDAHAGFIKGGKGFAVKHSGQVPLVHVRHVAQMIVDTVVQETNEDVIHLLSEPLLSQQHYIEKLKEYQQIGTTISLPWTLYSLMATCIRTLLSTLGKSHKVPDSFRKNSVAARQKPFQFSSRYFEQLSKTKQSPNHG